ncbi:hypothetical protein WMF31_11185 [Sorangium sp. So ce1036]|uniref:hypothetical protein n=1 Tax=Sorangium sp. So ce1036 TaxID=3133328 RepID=UPI003F0D6124
MGSSSEIGPNDPGELSPFDLRALVAAKPDVRTAVGRIFAEEIARATKHHHLPRCLRCPLAVAPPS